MIKRNQKQRNQHRQSAVTTNTTTTIIAIITQPTIHSTNTHSLTQELTQRNKRICDTNTDAIAAEKRKHINYTKLVRERIKEREKERTRREQARNSQYTTEQASKLDKPEICSLYKQTKTKGI